MPTCGNRDRAILASAVESLQKDGFARLDNHLDPSQLSALSVEAAGLFERPEILSDRHPAGWLEVGQPLELSALYRELLRDPVPCAAAVALLGPDIELANGGELDQKVPESPTSWCGWHSDFIWMGYLPRPRPFFWLSAYYFIEDVDVDSGPVWVMPGSHRWEAEPQAGEDDPTGGGRLLEGSQPLTGKAGTLYLMNNEIWHMSPPNRSERPRVIFKLHFKPGWTKWHGKGREPSKKLRDMQVDPPAQQLLAVFDHDDVPWQHGEDVRMSRYPVVNWLRSEGLLLQP